LKSHTQGRWLFSAWVHPANRSGLYGAGYRRRRCSGAELV